ncbi:hypothetical protein BV898_19341 [Hypsibius exemplaris]|uniref:GAIN-B domain-containing protein n=1 Tax=Hypsibius exemplaris TaxID=2072580 RepID=A0A9X6NS13_HYPEX|nr:hypothetical protein BV898_19341 [Hypsibius exemplaris]
MKVDLDPSSGNESFTINVPNLVVRSFVVPNDTKITRRSIVGFAAGVEPTDITAVRRDDHVTALKEETSERRLVHNLKDPVTITALVDHYDPQNNYSCVFWNTTAANGRGTWQEEGCALTNRSNKHFTCICNHLTSFAILVDFATKLVKGEPPPSLPAFLDTLTIAALSLSIVGAALTIGANVARKSHHCLPDDQEKEYEDVSDDEEVAVHVSASPKDIPIMSDLTDWLHSDLVEDRPDFER